MGLNQDWYIYHSKDEINWILQEDGPYTEERSLEVLQADEAKRQDMSDRVARVSYPHGALPDKKIERRGLDLVNQNKD